MAVLNFCKPTQVDLDPQTIISSDLSIGNYTFDSGETYLVMVMQNEKKTITMMRAFISPEEVAELITTLKGELRKIVNG